MKHALLAMAVMVTATSSAGSCKASGAEKGRGGHQGTTVRLASIRPAMAMGGSTGMAIRRIPAAPAMLRLEMAVVAVLAIATAAAAID